MQWLTVDLSLLKTPIKETIIIFDDVLTKGSHFKAAKRKLQQELDTTTKIIGFFIGRSYYSV